MSGTPASCFPVGLARSCRKLPGCRSSSGPFLPGGPSAGGLPSGRGLQLRAVPCLGYDRLQVVGYSRGGEELCHACLLCEFALSGLSVVLVPARLGGELRDYCLPVLHVGSLTAVLFICECPQALVRPDSKWLLRRPYARHGPRLQQSEWYSAAVGCVRRLNGRPGHPTPKSAQVGSPGGSRSPASPGASQWQG